MLWWLAQNAVLAGALAVVVALACRLGRFRPAVQHALWLVVLLKLLTPPQLTWPGPVLPLGGSPGPAAQPTAGAEADDEQARSLAVLWDLAVADAGEPTALDAAAAPLVIEAGPPVGGTELRTLAAADPPEAPAPAGPSWVTWAWSSRLPLRLLFGGAAALGLLEAARLLRLRRRLAGASPAPPELVTEVAALAARLGLRPPAVRVVSGIASPLVCGLGRPLLVWPDGLCLPPACRRAVLVHELAHLRRRDHWVAWLRLAAGCLWWWNPLYWLVCRQLGQTAELACDAWVVATLPEARRPYAEALLHVARTMSGAALPAPAVGMSAGRRRDLERRLTMIMTERMPCRAPVLGLVVIGLLALAALPNLSPGQPPSPQKPLEPAQPPAVQQAPVPVQVGQPANAAPVYAEVLLQQAAPPAADGDRDRKLQELEQKIQALLKEVQAMRGTKKPVQANVTPPAYYRAEPLVRGQALVQPPAAAGDLIYSLQVDRSPDTVTLTRAIYKLPKDKAEALAAFLREHVKATVLEAKAEGDGLIVTTTPDTQRTIGQFIALVQGKQAGTPTPAPKNLLPAQPAPAKQP